MSDKFDIFQDWMNEKFKAEAGPELETSVCKMCRREIYYFPPYWRHKGMQPRHPAIPSDNKKDSPLERMAKIIKEEKSIDMDHVNADEILCEVLEEMGQSELVQEYRKLEKYYS